MLGGLAAQVVEAGIQFFPSSPQRLAAGALIAGANLSRVLPPPFSIWLDGAGLNLGMLFFMALSTKLLWHGPKEGEYANAVD